jgi:hypothetical protein
MFLRIDCYFLWWSIVILITRGELSSRWATELNSNVLLVLHSLITSKGVFLNKGLGYIVALYFR